jgi:hypothetical protein
MSFLRRLAGQHLSLKVSALAISLTLWAAYTSEPLVEAGLNAPLVLVNVPSGLEVAGDVSTAVRVRVRGRSILLRRLETGDLSVRVDCTQARAGSQLVQLVPGMADVPYGVEVVEIMPSEIQVTLVSGSAPPPGAK